MLRTTDYIPRGTHPLIDAIYTSFEMGVHSEMSWVGTLRLDPKSSVVRGQVYGALECPACSSRFLALRSDEGGPCPHCIEKFATRLGAI